MNNLNKKNITVVEKRISLIFTHNLSDSRIVSLPSYPKNYPNYSFPFRACWEGGGGGRRALLTLSAQRVELTLLKVT